MGLRYSYQRFESTLFFFFGFQMEKYRKNINGNEAQSICVKKSPWYEPDVIFWVYREIQKLVAFLGAYLDQILREMNKISLVSFEFQVHVLIQASRSWQDAHCPSRNAQHKILNFWIFWIFWTLSKKMCNLNWKQWNLSWSHRQKRNDSSSSRWDCLVVSCYSRATVFTQVKQSTGDFRGKITQAWFLCVLWKEQIKPCLI